MVWGFVWFFFPLLCCPERMTEFIAEVLHPAVPSCPDTLAYLRSARLGGGWTGGGGHQQPPTTQATVLREKRFFLGKKPPQNIIKYEVSHLTDPPELRC